MRSRTYTPKNGQLANEEGSIYGFSGDRDGGVQAHSDACVRYFVASARTEKDNRVVFAPPELIRISWGKLLKYKVQQALGGRSRLPSLLDPCFGNQVRLRPTPTLAGCTL